MAKISLRMYNREIEGVVEQGQRLDEAIAHCRHILHTYPKHLETYRMLGKAYLEAKRYDQAVDIFQRVLVAAPEDFVSHVGMSIIADDKGRLDDAIWHMERAFEVQPSNAAIQGELQRLFGRRDGVEPPKIRLTRGALAHMYVQGELFNQAIAEIRAVLNGDPKRTDMQTLLARAYFRNGQKTEAADICNQLLMKYPYSLDANRLMAEIAPATGRADAAQEFRQRVIELDPYAAFASDSLFHADGVPDSQVTIERLEYSGEMAEMPPSLGIGLESDATMMSRPANVAPAPEQAEAVPADLPEWLKTSAEAASTGPAVPAAPEMSDIPEFLRKAGWDAAASSEPEQPIAAAFEEQPGADAAIEGELPEWVKALAPAGEDTIPAEPAPPSEVTDVFQSTAGSLDQALSDDTPDWLRGLGDQEAGMPEGASAESPAPAAAAPSLPPDAPDWLRELGPVPSEDATQPVPAADAAPDWLKDLGGRELDEPAAPIKNESEADWLSGLREEAPAAEPAKLEMDESPDWLKDFGNDLETPLARTTMPETPAPQEAAKPETPDSLGALGTTAQEQDAAMAWLEALAAKHGAKPEELVTDPDARTEAAPEWVDKAKEIGEQAAAPTQQAPAEPAEPSAVELEQPEAQTPQPLVEPEAEILQPPLEDQTGMWLRSLAEDTEKTELLEPVAEEPKEETFEFRSTLLEETEPVSAEPEPTDEEPAILAGSETPDWLKDLAETPAERTGMEDAPSWLRGLDEQENVQAGAQATTQPSEAASEETAADLPAWLAGLDKEEASMAPPVPRRGPSEELPAWLQAEAEAEAEPEAKEPANPADWRPLAPPEPPPAETKPPVVELEPEPAPAEIEPPVVEEQPEPVVERLPEREMPPVPAPAPVVEQPPLTEAAPAPQPVEKAPERVPAAPRPRPASVQTKPAAVTLVDAQSQLGRGNIAAALSIYSKLIRKGKSLEDIIRDLRDALYRYPVEVPLWQSLGDAYMRANRLQEALDAYTKAEELLR
jgi:tetratricopeptide (TPR) repeat protein